MSLKHAMQRMILGALALVTLTVAPALAADPVFPLGSRLGLVPPAGFVPTNKFVGFENPQASAAILFITMPGDAFAEIEKAFTDEALKGRGITVALREQMTFKDGKGIFIAGPKEQNGVKTYESAMLTNIGGLTSIVSVQMLETARATITDAVVREALKTISVRATIPESEQLAMLPYKIGNLAGFHVIRSGMDGTAYLTLGPKDVVTNVEQPFILIGVVAAEAPKPDERDKVARQAFSSAPGIKDIKIIRSEPLRFGQAQGHEIIAEAKDATSNIEVTTVQWLRFGTNAHLQMFGIVKRSAWNEVYPKLRAVRDGIEPRN